MDKVNNQDDDLVTMDGKSMDSRYAFNLNKPKKKDKPKWMRKESILDAFEAVAHEESHEEILGGKASGRSRRDSPRRQSVDVSPRKNSTLEVPDQRPIGVDANDAKRQSVPLFKEVFPTNASQTPNANDRRALSVMGKQNKFKPQFNSGRNSPLRPMPRPN